MNDPTYEASDAAPMRRPWRKSSFSEPSQCVEAGMRDDGTVVMRNSNDHSQGTLTLSQDSMRAFLQGAKAGEFDDFV